MKLKNLYINPIKKFGQSVLNHPFELEGLLRPPLEYNTALVAGAASALFFVTPELFLMSDFYGACVGSAFALFALKRFCEGSYIRLYKKYLQKPPLFKVNIGRIAKKYQYKNALYSGVGFKWRPKHTQRFYDLETIQDFNKQIEDAETVLGGKLHLHGVGILNEKTFELKMSDRQGHVLVYGQSGKGKSRVLEIWLEQDIKAGHALFLVDPKGDKDLVKRVLLAAKRAGRLHDVLILHLGYPEQSVRYNPIKSYQRISEVAGRIASKLPSDGDSQAFMMFAWRFVFVVAQALERLNQEITIKRIKDNVQDLDNLLYSYAIYFLDLDEPSFIAKLDENYNPEAEIPKHLQGKSTRAIKVINYFDRENVKVDDVLNNILNAYSYEKTYYDKITASLLPFLEQLSSIGDMTNTAQQSDLPELSIQEAIDQKKIVVFALDGLSDSTVAHAMGAMFFADIVSCAGKMYKERERFDDIIIHADEFNDVIGDDMMPLSNKSRGAGVILHAYTQTDSDIEVGIKDKGKASIVKGNFTTRCSMCVGAVETARFFTDGLSDVKVKYSVSNTQLNDSNSKLKGTTAVTADRVQTEDIKLVPDYAVMSQPKGQMFVLKNGGQLYHVRFPLINDDLNKLVVDIEEYGTGNLVRDVNLRQFNLRSQ
ncbi:conjugative transfer system coupling protein TraD [Cysteiniphilum marinum]|uniref:conjugative transfer system coupling protein TraD n=1 Tax=Cysteiniphilum marinum TaxID=2774191 RepID=UPI00193A532E|nr:conjugative transfer system coupling protein TraD [Cysteiniphilum marinum]